MTSGEPATRSHGHERPGAAGRAASLAFATLLLVFGLAFGWMAWAGNRTFMRVLVDTDVAMWHSVMRHVLQGSLPLYRNPYSRTWTHYFAADHVNPLLFLVAPLWALMPSNVLFAWVQVAAYAGTGVLLYAVAKVRLESSVWAAAIAGAFLLSPLPTWSLHNHFSSSPFLILFLPAAVWCLLRGKTGWYWAAIAGLLLSREDAAILAMAVGLYAIAATRRHWLGALTVAIAGTYLVLVVRVVMPYLAGGFPYPYVSLGYGWLGPTPAAALGRLVGDPWWVVQELYRVGAIQALALHLLPFAFTPLASWRGLILLLPLGYLVLHLHAHTLSYHHAYRAATLAGLAAVEGVRTLRLRMLAARPGRTPETGLAALMLALAVTTHVGAAYSPVSRHFDRREFSSGPRERAMRAAMAAVPPAGRVTASRIYLTHLAPTRTVDCIWEHVDIREAAAPVGLVCVDTGAPMDSEYVLLTDVRRGSVFRRVSDSPAYALVFERRGTVLYRRVGGPAKAASGTGLTRP
jgi:uncharacterized membrane protein